MAKFIFRLVFYLIFWLGGWIGLRSLPQGPELLNRQLFLETAKTKSIFGVGLAIWLVVLVVLFFYRHSFGRWDIFRFQADWLNIFLLLAVGLLLAANFLAIFLIKEKNLTVLTLCLVGVTLYYLADTLFQQLINFGFLQEGFSKIVSPPTAIFGAAFLFGISHFLSMMEGTKFPEALGLVVAAFFLGLVFAFLRLKYNSLIPGFLLHFSIYLFVNGPFLYLLTRRKAIC